MGQQKSNHVHPLRSLCFQDAREMREGAEQGRWGLYRALSVRKSEVTAGIPFFVFLCREEKVRVRKRERKREREGEEGDGMNEDE